MRLDLYLVELKLVDSRARAKMEIDAGNVFVNDKVCEKPSFNVKDNDLVELKNKLPWVSRGGLKLEHAMKFFNIDFNNKVVLDIGSSTGGFSDVALTNGAKSIYCVDTGSDILHEKIRNNKKVSVFEKTDYRNLNIAGFEKIDIIVIDVSFISLEKILPKLKNDFDGKNVYVMSLIKPQFEVGKTIATKYKGVIRDKKLQQEVVDKIVNSFKTYGFECLGITDSPILGGDGNREFLAYFKR
jgi:23S rRNA (cytidine1920-2'-O)/16S rRNA (cytidine1409-2'-O)-methyltransferase